ncbi:cys-loop ligand-gated ion channel-like isoform X2 [Branchiostoma floridae x Branchiostoma japonicum]
MKAVALASAAAARRHTYSAKMSSASLDGNEVTKGMRKIQSMLRKFVEEETEFTPRKDGKKVAVHIRCFIVQVGQIDTLKEEFTCDAVVEAFWEEPQLNGATAEDIHWDDQWDPRIVFFNAVSVDRLEKQRVFFKGSSGQPWVRLTMHIKGTFKVAMQLFNFPFDHQELKIELMSDWSDKHMILCPYLDEKDAISTSTFTGGDEWYLHAHMMTCQGKTETEITGPDTIFPTYDVIINVTRRWTYYFWNIFVIMFLILLLTFSSFALDTGALESRLDVTLTLLLTSVAFKLVLAQRLPTISYLTLLDIYILAVLTVQGLIVILHTTMSVITNKNVASLFNIVSSVVLGVMVVLCHVALVIYIATVKRHPGEQSTA